MTKAALIKEDSSKIDVRVEWGWTVCDVYFIGGDEWKTVVDRLGLKQSEIRFLDRRFHNPFEEALIHSRNQQGLNVGQLYDALVDCGFPLIADLL